MTAQNIDPRFSLANERTFLAWMRTALGLVAGAAAVQAVDVPWPGAVVRGIATLLTVVGGLSAYLGWDRWRRVQQAIDAGGAVPPTPRSHLMLPGTVVIAAVVIVLVTFL
jgi:putative membrane protein